ncbi:pyrimidine/purine nucleoside phosphorylase [Pedobacter sp. N36a]|uniref:pyrimidine/purine nucleoside phosphorylase n=1 Tax=Pedobacter sp. N36a TaxID=2767996 RepID=UPI001657408A|nr:pyrimidine/purine nucleoside phosphorylase [Pedobacter sp. N36a]MBC8984750.1 pyrimidine/purine nucleoside phosphorylase [Pedobacter sp. N36a]
MSNPHNTAPAAEIVSHNVYFEGKVQSLGLETPTGKATVGVMKTGSYTFSASSPETMLVISGRMQVRFSGKDDQQQYEAQESFEVPAESSFEVHCEADVAYICYYA